MGRPRKEAVEFSSRIENPLLQTSPEGEPVKDLLSVLRCKLRGFQVALPGVEALPAASVEPLGLQTGEATLPWQDMGRADPVDCSPPNGSQL